MTSKAERSSESQNWRTPQWFFDLLDERFHFIVDLAADQDSTKCGGWFGPGSMAMDDSSNGGWVEALRRFQAVARVGAIFSGFLNPPYGHLGVAQWILAARDEARKGLCVVVLVNSRTDKDWFHMALQEAAEVLFVRSRIRFVDPETGEESKQPTAPNVVLVFHPVFRGPARVDWLPGREKLIDEWRQSHKNWRTP